MLTLILLPGLDGTGLLFEPFIQALGKQTRVRLVGYPRDKPLQYQELKSYVKSLLPDNEQYVLLAESFAGPIAIQLAAEGNSQLRGLILCCTFACSPRAGLAWTGPLLNLIPFHWIPTPAISHFLLGKFTTAALRAAIAGAVAQVVPEVVRTRIRAVLEVDVSPQLARIRVPCLYLRATDDRLVPASASAHIRSRLPTTRIRVINGPHCLLQAAPSEAAQAVNEFLLEVASASANPTPLEPSP
jgi:pimeloyl-ACP methyl ester carboxylesterase